MSFVRIIVLALALTHMVGLADMVMDDSCGEICSDDGCGDDCLPGVACRCHCPSAIPLLAGQAQTITKLFSRRTFAPSWGDERAHANPDPIEILHVPKLAV